MLKKEMNIVTTTCVYPAEISEVEKLERFSKIGFRFLDLAMDGRYFKQIESDNWEFWADQVLNKAKSLGIKYTHSHANANSETRGIRISRCFEVCKALGISYTVVHPMHEKHDGSYFYELEEFVKVNAEALKPIIEMAEKYQVTVLTENLCWEQCASLEAITELVKEVNSPYFGWCFDTGHFHSLFGDNDIPLLKKITLPPLSLHVQDNHGRFREDEHLLPGDGTIDWKVYLTLLRNMGYNGELVLEAHHQPLAAPDDQRDYILSDLLNRSEKLRSYYLGETSELNLL